MIRSSDASAVLLFAATAATQGQVFVVDDEAGAGVDFTDLQLAIDLASDGDLILVKEGSFEWCWLDGLRATVWDVRVT